MFQLFSLSGKKDYLSEQNILLKDFSSYVNQFTNDVVSYVKKMTASL